MAFTLPASHFDARVDVSYTIKSDKNKNSEKANIDDRDYRLVSGIIDN